MVGEEEELIPMDRDQFREILDKKLLETKQLAGNMGQAMGELELARV